MRAGELAELVSPAITTVRQPLGEIAKVSVQRLHARIHGDDGPPYRSRISPQLVVRESSVRKPR
jgi:LacI family transcriptional regulator